MSKSRIVTVEELRAAKAELASCTAVIEREIRRELELKRIYRNLLNRASAKTVKKHAMELN